MIRAIEEYNKLVVQPSFKWLKKYWKGYLIILSICMVVGVLYAYIDEIADKIEMSKNVIKQKAKRIFKD